MNLKYFSFLLTLIALVLLKEPVPLFLQLSCVGIFIVFFINIKNSYLKNAIKIIFLFVNCFLLWKKFHSLFVTECGVSLVILLCTLKLLELDTVDDFFNMFLILILSESCVIITNPSSIYFTFGFLKIGFYFYFLVKLQNYELGLLNIRRILILVMPALIFSIFLYYTFPRFTQGFASPNSIDGLIPPSSNLDIKEFAEVNLSDKKIFTVLNIHSDNLNANSLYWKTQILWEFKRGKWRPGNLNLKVEEELYKKIPNKVHYNIKTENVYFDYLPHLDTYSNIAADEKTITSYHDNTFKLNPPSKGSYNLHIDSSLDRNNVSSIEEINKAADVLQDPDENSEIYKTLIKNNTFYDLSTQERLNRVKDYFISRHFQYSKSPPHYESLDEFILKGREGYCLHFASAYALLLRFAKIPSRIVKGFQGGEVNTFDQSIIVREYDGHAWVEYLFANNWVRIDPTQFVAPARLTLGFKKFLDQLAPYYGNSFIQVPKSWFRIQIIDSFEQLIASYENSFSNRVFNFNSTDQKNLFKNKAGLYFVLVLIFFLISLFYLTKLSKKVAVLPAQRRFDKLIKKFGKKGFFKIPSETAGEYRARLLKNFPDDEQEINLEIKNYIDFFYR
jgi:hypothetical protein